MKMNFISRCLLLSLILLLLTAFSVQAYNASGTYTYNSGPGPGPLSLTVTASDFLCDGFTVDSFTVTVISVTETELVWEEEDSWRTTFTRTAGTAGDISGTWNFTNPDTGSVYALTFNHDATVSLAGNISQCYVDGSPAIASFSPASAMAGTLLTINGSNFSPILNDNVVSFNGVPAVVTGARAGQLFVVVPGGAASGTISVTNFGGTATSSNSFNVTAGIPAPTLSWGGVHHRLDSDVTEFDALDVGINSYAPTLAGMTLSVSGPNGFSYTFTDADKYQYSNGQLAAQKRYPTPAPPLAAGVYTFTLNDGQGNISHRVDTHVTIAGPLPPVDSSTIQLQRRADGSYRFSWAPVNATKTYYYRLRINRNDSAESFVYDSSRAMTTFADVPKGVLFDDSMYKVRVETVDSANGDLATNRSLSTWKLFTPDDYDANRLLVNYALAYNRFSPTGVLSTDVFLGFLGVNTSDSVNSLQLLNSAGAVIYTFDLASDKSGTDFYKNFPAPLALAPGAYTLRFEANGLTHYAYATLTTPVAYPTPDPATLQAEYLSDGSIRFSWANVNHTGALYYRLSVNDTSTGAFITTARRNQTYVDMTAASLGNLATKTWRVEVYDSDQFYTQRNRANSPSKEFRNTPPVAYDSTKPLIDYYVLANANNWDVSSEARYELVTADTGVPVMQGRIDGPNGFSRNLSHADTDNNDFNLVEAGSPASGLYTYTAEGNTGNSSIRYKYQPAPYNIAAVDYQAFQVDSEPNGATRISWAPVVSDVPLWYSLELFNTSTMTEIDIPEEIAAGSLMQMTSVSIPAQYMQGQLAFRVVTLDSNNALTINNGSKSVMVRTQAGFNYSALLDADNDGYAANLDPNDNNPDIDPTTPVSISIPGDCNENGTVSIDEVQSAINMFLGVNPVQLCADTDKNDTVSIDEVQKVINSFLGLNNDPTVRDTSFGKVAGKLDSPSSAIAWFGIPYASPPTGSLRWKAPIDPAPWSTTLKATATPKACIQNVTVTDKLLGVILQSEDCLTLNIWSPATGETNLPVVVFVHGGSNMTGYGYSNMYWGGKLASEQKVVFVSLNYRLNLFGWFDHPALKTGDLVNDSGNFGTLDIMQALKFVKSNIANFGGNPDNITLAGHSAGATNVWSLIASPKAAGLFHKAIPMSGSAAGSSPANARDYANTILQQAVIRDGKASDVAGATAYLASLSNAQVREYLYSLPASSIISLLSIPIVSAANGGIVPTRLRDGVVLPPDSATTFTGNFLNNVPVLSGTTNEEGKAWAGSYFKKNQTVWDALMNSNPDNPTLTIADIILPHYLPANKPFTSCSDSGYNAINLNAGFVYGDTATYCVNNIWNTTYYWNSQINTLNKYRPLQLKTYAYNFAWAQQPEPVKTILGSPHGADVPFMFGTISPNLNNNMTIGFSSANAAGREALSHKMRTAMATFIRTGNPNNPDLGTTWLPWSTVPGEAKRLVFDADYNNASIVMSTSDTPIAR